MFDRFNVFMAIMFFIVFNIIFFVLFYNYKSPYIDINNRTRTREEIADEILRKGCINKEECDEFLKKLRKDILKKSWAE